MNYDMSAYFEDPEFKEALARYEGMVENHTPAYFEADEPVSYTHLDVYKRQGVHNVKLIKRNGITGRNRTDERILQQTDIVIINIHKMCIRDRFNNSVAEFNKNIKSPVEY